MSFGVFYATEGKFTNMKSKAFSYKVFNCEINRNVFCATTAGEVVLFHDWHKKPATDMTHAIEAIARDARRYGYKKMRVYVDLCDGDAPSLLRYFTYTGGVSMWTDGRFLEYEWSI